MKNKTNLWTKFLIFFLGCLGFACGGNNDDNYDELEPTTDTSDNGGSMVCLYGSPSAIYKVQGTITDTEGKPVDNVKARFGSCELYEGFDENNIDSDYVDEWYESYGIKLINVNDDGTYSEELDTYPIGGDFYLKAEAPGYETDSTVFSFGELSGGDKSWFCGSASATVNITLKKAEESNDSDNVQSDN